ncbi:MAG: hypothetical protein HN729_07700 [Candidatus Marinimicrobia bacterium]|jgi:putative flippase GtrA|nr:hypothetical protein [Candidatus Neomarinimicrobiota bacterium]MBT3633022.1 hypothetical protein [Candidatus Neomarinimicrobiota bacterium]MBT3683536.1 hypothetical protein [Candidatus Neomarinimicrobiota bacterium]MBT3758622.1 hypothetical protein [Candidatus Neomarinimicrobiota bacterium]MBT3896469.1 hypothetical protein [Candidatus Neomarinimicrobiota bacterium]
MNISRDIKSRHYIIEYFYQIPENIRMMLTAVFGAAIGFATYEIIYYFNPMDNKATTSWIIAFTLGVARQHGLHRLITFEHYSPYWRSLGRAYIMYSASAFIGSTVNYMLVQNFDIHHRMAWLCCLGITASISLIFLKKHVFIPG